MTVDEYGAVRAHALRLCLAAGATVEEAEDCVQEALAELLAQADPDAVRAPAGWVATVSRRRLVDQVRRRSRERVASRRQHPIGPAIRPTSSPIASSRAGWSGPWPSCRRPPVTCATRSAGACPRPRSPRRSG